jgi:glycosyltransferase involved in cell wall biosynthesis
VNGERPRLGWLAPEDCTLPPPPDSGSITTVIWQLATRLADRYELVLAARRFDGPEWPGDDRIRIVRHTSPGDLRRAAAVEVVNKVERKLHLRDVPYAARASYFRGYARAQAVHLRDAGVDLVHLHNTSQWIPALREQLPSTPIVLQMHCEWLTEIPDRVARARLADTDLVVAVSEQVAATIRERFPTPVEVVPNGVDVDLFRPRREDDAPALAELRRRLGLHDGPVVLYVGRLSAEKGLHVLLEAAPAIGAAVPGTQVVLVGPAHGLRSPLPTRRRRELAAHPEWRTRYVDHLRRLAGAGTHLVGPVRHGELPLLYALADAYVQPSFFDAFPLPVVEAAACALPVVATTAGAPTEILEDGTTGCIVPVGDPGALADAVVRVLADRPLASRLGCEARARVVRELTWERVADRLAAVVDPLLTR